jgi:hypothetical protein
MKLLKEIWPNIHDNQPFSVATKALLLSGLFCLNIENAQAETLLSDSVAISGKVINTTTKAPVKAKIYYRDIPNGNVMGITESSADGHYNIVVYERGNYAIEVLASGYTAGHVVANASSEEVSNVSQDINLAPVAAKQVIDLRSLVFNEENEIAITAYDDLDRLVGMLQTNPTLTVSIGNGHKSNATPEQRDLHIKAVRHFLVKRGVVRNRIKVLADNVKPHSDIDQSVEVTVLKPN